MAESEHLLFSHREAVLVTGVSDEALHSWVRRGYVVPAVASMGRGKRRAYDQMNLVQIQVLNSFAQAGIDPSLSALVFEQLRPLAADLITAWPLSRFVPIGKPATSSHGQLDRTYRYWLIDRWGMVSAEFVRGPDGALIPDRPFHHLPPTAMWIAIDVQLNEWVLFPIEYVQAGRPQTEEDFETWLDHRVMEAKK
ncbi:MerR family transcriptional regulator [Caulobacter sp. FWC26]|uniref:MerR family transcriptional regulator n=1 Tax=Caulobacter sp. FWC26 TaxID=69665 RepID=UPI000C15B647|nr:MerR family transcriptional regulator [Caulobacter sp. FWC26]AZS20066.1 hypothetical protein CSW63_05050 [Caulobacter sp. FWC26]